MVFKVIIPKLSQDKVKRLDEVNESVAVAENGQEMNTSNSYVSFDTINKSATCRRPLARSSTENFISSLAQSSAPFGSILAPITVNDEEEESEAFCENGRDGEQLATPAMLTTDLDVVARNRDQEKHEYSEKNVDDSASSKRVYSLDFLLSRADVQNSKTMPENWRQLSALYPNVCFSGKVDFFYNAMCRPRPFLF